MPQQLNAPHGGTITSGLRRRDIPSTVHADTIGRQRLPNHSNFHCNSLHYWPNTVLAQGNVSYQSIEYVYLLHTVSGVRWRVLHNGTKHTRASKTHGSGGVVEACPLRAVCCPRCLSHWGWSWVQLPAGAFLLPLWDSVGQLLDVGHVGEPNWTSNG